METQNLLQNGNSVDIVPTTISLTQYAMDRKDFIILCLPQTLEALKRVRPKRALLIGMTHDFDHHKDNEFLMEWSEREGIHVQLERAGLRVPIDL